MKYRVYAGCSNEGTILHGQPYDGPTDLDSLLAFASETLKDSPYGMSNTVYGLEMDWAESTDYPDVDGMSHYVLTDYDACDCADDCNCEPEDYFVGFQLNVEDK